MGFVSADSIMGGDMVVEISQVDSGKIEGGDMIVFISMTDRFINNIIIGSEISIPPVTPSGGGGGGGAGIRNYIQYYIRNKQNTSYVHVIQLNSTHAEFKVYINYSSDYTKASLYLFRNEENTSAYEMRPNFNNSYIVILNNKQLKPRDVLKYYVLANDSIQILTPLRDYDIYIWKYMGKFNRLTLIDLMYIFIIIIVSLLWFLLVFRNKKRRKKPKPLNNR